MLLVILQDSNFIHSIHALIPKYQNYFSCMDVDWHTLSFQTNWILDYACNIIEYMFLVILQDFDSFEYTLNL